MSITLASIPFPKILLAQIIDEYIGDYPLIIGLSLLPSDSTIIRPPKYLSSLTKGDELIIYGDSIKLQNYLSSYSSSSSSFYPYSEIGFHYAGVYGYDHILSLLYSFSLPLFIHYAKITNTPFNPIRGASESNRPSILHWWKDKSIPFPITDAIDKASIHGHVPILQFWKEYIDSLPLSNADQTDVRWSSKAIDYASGNGHIHVLQWWLQSGLQCRYTDHAVDRAASLGRIDVLQWWLQSGLKVKYSPTAFVLASERGYLDVLDLFVKADLPFKITTAYIDCASAFGQVHVLDWWKSYLGQRIMYTTKALNQASAKNQLASLRWWANSKLELAFTEEAMNLASNRSHFDVLDWWLDNKTELGLELDYNNAPIDFASKEGNIPVLEWWKASGLTLYYTNQAIDMISSYNRHDEVKDIDTLEWWRTSALPLKYTTRAMNDASAFGKLHILHWYHQSGLILRFTEGSMDRASGHGYVQILEWWRKSGLNLLYTSAAIDDASFSGHVNVLEWWKNSGLDLKYTTKAYDSAKAEDKSAAIEWWHQSGLEIKEGTDAWVANKSEGTRNNRSSHKNSKKQVSISNTCTLQELEAKFNEQELESPTFRDFVPRLCVVCGERSKDQFSAKQLKNRTDMKCLLCNLNSNDTSSGEKRKCGKCGESDLNKFSKSQLASHHGENLPTCLACLGEPIPIVSHIRGEATPARQRVCTKCGETEKDKFSKAQWAHKADESHPRCILCSEKLGLLQEAQDARTCIQCGESDKGKFSTSQLKNKKDEARCLKCVQEKQSLLIKAERECGFCGESDRAKFSKNQLLKANPACIRCHIIITVKAESNYEDDSQPDTIECKICGRESHSLDRNDRILSIRLGHICGDCKIKFQ